MLHPMQLIHIHTDHTICHSIGKKLTAQELFNSCAVSFMKFHQTLFLTSCMNSRGIHRCWNDNRQQGNNYRPQ